jgi:hypothetical protein
MGASSSMQSSVANSAPTKAAPKRTSTANVKPKSDDGW